MSSRITKLSRVAGVSALFLSLAALAPTADGPVLKDRDQKELGTAIRALIDAKEGKPAEKAKKNLVDLLTKYGKGLNKKNVDPVQAALSLTADLGRAFYMSEEHELAGLKPGDVAETVFTIPGGDKDQKITFSTWTPKSYKPNAEPMPIVVFLPGTKEGKNVSGKQFLIEHWIEGDIRDKAILVAVNMPDDPKIWSEIQTEDGRTGGVSVVMRTLNKIKEMYAVDYDRVYIGGRETGVAAALSIASLYPQVFAAAFGQAGDAGPANWENFRNLPTYFAGGGASATAFEEKSKAAGYDNCMLQAEGTDADVWKWMQDKRRTSYPAKVTLVPATLGPFRSYWVEIPRQEVAGDLRVEADYDRASNRLEIKGTNAKQVTVFLNDAMLDLDKPIKVVCNGVEKEEKVSRSLDDTLNFLRRGTSDPGRLYVASRTFDLPKAAKE